MFLVPKGNNTSYLGVVFEVFMSKYFLEGHGIRQFLLCPEPGGYGSHTNLHALHGRHLHIVSEGFEKM